MVSVVFAGLPNALKEGCISFLRIQQYKPVICIKKNSHWLWVSLDDLSSETFIKYRGHIAQYIKKIQSDIRGLPDTIVEERTKYVPHPHEEAFLRQIFNNHLTSEDKKRYLLEFSHTIISKKTCIRCLNWAKIKKKCLHCDCPGMCEKCYDEMDKTCLVCLKEQQIKCPICLNMKIEAELAPGASCGHYVCWSCLGKSYQCRKQIKKCPLCRTDWLPRRNIRVNPRAHP